MVSALLPRVCVLIRSCSGTGSDLRLPSAPASCQLLPELPDPSWGGCGTGAGSRVLGVFHNSLSNLPGYGPAEPLSPSPVNVPLSFRPFVVTLQRRVPIQPSTS